MAFSVTRPAVVLVTAAAVSLPLGLVIYQSVLTGPFFLPKATFSLGAFEFVLRDPEFWLSLRNSLLIAFAMLAIALPIGALMAFLVTRTDMPGRRALEPLILVPILVSPIVLALGYVIAAGPVGIYSSAAHSALGFVPWNIYSPISIAVIGGLSHVPYAYLYTSTALRGLGSDVEEAARVAGARPWRVAIDVNLPMIRPALFFSAVLLFFSGVEMFGLALVLGNQSNFSVLAIYLYKLTSRLGVPAYHLMAAVAVMIVFMTFPLVMLQRYYLSKTERFASMRGKATRPRPVALGKWRWPAFAAIGCWLFVTAFVPISGISLRAFINYGAGTTLIGSLTVEHFHRIFTEPALLRSVVNSVVMGVVGGLLAVAAYACVALATHRRADGWTRLIDYLVLLPRAVPGLLAGLAFLWAFIFFKPLSPLRPTLISVWIAYTIVWLSYGTRLISGTLFQVGKELEEAGRSLGASRGRTTREITIPLIRNGLLATWLLVFLMFEREYAAGVYLLTAGTEMIGPMLVTLSETGDLDAVAALSFVNLLLIGAGVGLAFRYGVRLND
ncbi:iron ABC transporter permease [Ensifer sp. SSB1]|uniref:ABC transporter permease n=1 Tax=Ensifer sp. SSB1 TaxID=2795385 RepID=UPI001A46B17C|nr:iron ABC transporter permease [Ensifer sp. SSB1]MBK5567882.1 iron ABC transporter permease [Ensifer sp. SSB1]